MDIEVIIEAHEQRIKLLSVICMPDKWIPMVLGVFSVVLSAVWVIATSDISGLQEIASATFTAVTQGILVAGAGVYVNQLKVQAKKEE